MTDSHILCHVNISVMDLRSSLFGQGRGEGVEKHDWVEKSRGPSTLSMAYLKPLTRLVGMYVNIRGIIQRRLYWIKVDQSIK